MRRRTTALTLPAPEVAVDAPAVPVPATGPMQPAMATWAPAAAPRGGRALEERLTSWLLRAGLAFVLTYAATASLVHPEAFARYFPGFVPATWANRLLPVFALFEALLAAALMTHRYAYVASLLAGLTMIAIIAVNPQAFGVLFRNVAIACGAFALAAQTRRDRAWSPRSYPERTPAPARAELDGQSPMRFPMSSLGLGSSPPPPPDPRV